MILSTVKSILALNFCVFLLAFRIPLAIFAYITPYFIKTEHTPPSLFQCLTVTIIQTFQVYSTLPLLRIVCSLFESSTLISRRQRRRWVKKLDASNELDGWEGYFIADDVEHSEIGKDVDMFILFAHGGGFVCGNALGPLETLINWIKAWKSSHGAKVQILSLEYELSPENSFPVARDNMLACYKWLVDEKKISPSKIAFAGDSVGGNLALVSTLLLINQPYVFSLDTPCALILLSPFLSGLANTKSFANNASYDIISHTWFNSCLDSYLGDSNLLPSCPLVSPLFENNFSELPKVWISAGSYEIFLDDITAFTEKLLQDNVKVEFVKEDANLHDYAAYRILSRNGAYDNSIRQIGRFLFGGS